MGHRLIGCDVGGTKISVATLADGALSPPALTPTETASPEALIAQLVGIIGAARGVNGVAAVGIGVPSVVDFATGTVRASVNVPLTDLPLRERLRAELGVPVFVDNDGAVAALGEADGLGVRTLVMLTLGTGVGGGIVVDGRIFRGTTGAAGELGHTIVGAHPDEPSHRERFPQPGSLEALGSGLALDALGRERGFADGRATVEAAHAGDEAAREAVAILGRRIGLGVANAINTFDPEVVVIGGGVSVAGDVLLDAIRSSAARYVLPGVGTQTEIRVARLGPAAGVRGAALLAGQEIERGEPS